MKLKDYIDKLQMAPSSFARLIGMSPVTILALYNGTGRTRPSTASKIEKETNGEVTYAEIMGLK